MKQDPILAKVDEKSAKIFYDNLPYSLVIASEEGLDGRLLAKKLAGNEKSQILNLAPAENKTFISTAQARDLVKSLRTKPTTRRVVVIEKADALQEQAQNVLLKVLEEPAENTHFILVTTESKMLLETIRSRCQMLKLHQISSAQDNQMLKNVHLDEDEKRQILFLANGKPALIRELASNPQSFDEYKIIATDAKSLLTAEHFQYNTLKILQPYMTNRQRALKLLAVTTGIIRFYAHREGLSASMKKLLSEVEQSLNAVKSNGNVRLALMRLVIQ